MIPCLLVAQLACAQELEPRAYSPNPVGLNFATVGYAHSSGDVLSDPSLPLDDVHASLNAVSVGYGRTFGLFGRGAAVLLGLPQVWADVAGNIGEDRRSTSRTGLADARVRLTVNLLGGEALSPAEFAKREPGPLLGASLIVVAPTGEYLPDRLINIGSNRWAFKPELGFSYPIGRWYFDVAAGVWLFTGNDDFYGGSLREQDPVTTLQGHVVYVFRPRLWLAVDATYYEGGRTVIDGVPRADLQANSRIGLTLAVPLNARQSLKFAWSEGATTRIGGDFSSYGVVWQYAWFD